MNEETQKRIGTILDETARRDAIHIAVAPVVAQEWLNAGEHVTRDGRHAEYGGEAVGVVDPFLRTGVDKGQRFFIFLYPDTVTGMRHVWSHPAFDTTRREGT